MKGYRIFRLIENFIMIRSLYTKDFALIDELEVEFEMGQYTTDTGAGKSIIIGIKYILINEPY